MTLVIKTHFPLSFDLIILVGEYLELPDLAALIRTNRCFSELLTPHLNRRALDPSHCKAALLYAAVNRNRTLVHLLATSAKCLLARRNDVYQTIIFLAPATRRIEEVVDNIILEGNRLVVQDTHTFRTPLHDAAMTAQHLVLAKLLFLGVEINIHDFRGWTPLHHAVSENDLSATGLLLQHGASVNSRNNNDMTPLHFAANTGNFEITTLLLTSGADPCLGDSEGLTPIEMTKTRNHSIDSLLLLSSDANFRSSTNQTALHMASCLGDIAIVNTLIAAGVPINARDLYDGTALHESSAAGHPLIVDTLLRHGAAVNAQDRDGTTPLHCAATEEIAIILLAHHADMNIRDNRGATPLQYAPFEALLQHAASAMMIPAERTPLNHAVTQASIDLPAQDANVEPADEHMSTEIGDYEMAEVYVEMGKDEHAMCNDEETLQDTKNVNSLVE